MYEMNKWIKSILSKSLRRVSRSSFLQSLRVQEKSLVPLDLFEDIHGNQFQRFQGYRERVVPSWHRMFDPSPNPPMASLSQVNRARQEVAAMEDYFELYGLSVLNRHVLEVGCYGGAHAYALAEIGAAHIDAIDTPAYGIRQTPDRQVDRKTLEEQSRWLQQLRESTYDLFQTTAGTETCTAKDRTSFFDLDVVDLAAKEDYDVIVSWYTLEHITEPARAIANMFRALRPGGVCFHDYNPFFCVNGAHSLCTLDFPFGHCRLSENDFERYVRTYRPQELDVALRFYHQSLNRMTLADLRHYCETAGFGILALLEWHEKEDFQAVNCTVLSQCQVYYPSASVNDLLSRSIWLLLKKPQF